MVFMEDFGLRISDCGFRIVDFGVISFGLRL